MRRAVLLILALCFLTSITKPGFSEKPLRLFFEKNIRVEQKPGDEHIVKQGEWLYKILESKGYSATQIQRILPDITALNPHIPDINRLMPGQVIQIPEASSAADTGIRRPPPLAATKSYEKTPYVVRTGDTLIQILKAQGVPNSLIYSQYLDLFLELNPEIPNTNTLRVGQEIILPVTNQTEKVMAPAPPRAPAAQRSPKPEQIVVTQATAPSQAASVRSASARGASVLGAPGPIQPLQKQPEPSAPEPAQAPAAVLPKTPPTAPDSAGDADSFGQSDATNATAEKKRTPVSGLPFVKTVLEQMRFKFLPGDESMFPLPGSEWLVVKMSETPLLDAPWGDKILFCPVPKNAQWIANANKLGMKVCTISPRWSLQEVLEKLSSTFPKHFRLWGAGKELVLSRNGVGVTLLSPQMAIIERGGQKRIHMIWSRQTPDSPPLPQGLHEVLDEAQVKIIELDAYNELSRLPSRARESIYVPVATHLEIIRAMNPGNPEEIFGQAMPDTLSSLLQLLRDKDLLRQGMIQAAWHEGAQNRIAVQVPAWTVSGGTGKIAILDRRFSDPFLVSVLSHEGYTCFILPD
ncbi:LysM peptidoglycan-binding domain-containing protein [Desulfomicrobium baculatum]|uniref:Peptidoglycan-binding LysM n=1 Tax=Desulfomicrobium baculatum (strain DSM 4028 / VKM B-1378 / X) TaxID=525897 RepID=C7LNJ3_DESBD|nr:LysM peptidoglycan-binding domain-containing protein [Desulfomicrobium baculatum]ACU88878.1 Peptidoglycan-binding LysM [Desulfomicrobium baculatum DSM 4028]